MLRGDADMNNNILMKKSINIKKFLLDYALYIALLGIIILFSSKSETFLTVMNFKGMLMDATPMFSVCIGLTFVFLIGHLDLSVGMNMLICGSLGGLAIVKMGLPPMIGLLLMLLIGIIVGCINGILVVKLKLNPWLATLAMKLVLQGIALLCTNTDSVRAGKHVNQFKFNILGIPNYVILLVVIAIIMQLILKYTSFGRQVKATGSNSLAANKIGINTAKVRFAAFVISGLFAGLGAIMTTFNVGLVGPSTGNGYDFTAVTALVLGGVSLSGGRGNILPNALVGVLFLYIIENGLAMDGVDPYVFTILKGVIVFLAMMFDSMKNKN